MAKATDAQLRQIMLLIYEGVTGQPWSRDASIATPLAPRRQARPPRAPGDGASPAFLAEFAAWQARQDVA